MRRKKIQNETTDFFQQPEMQVHIFRAGDLTRILEMERWRLEKFLTGKLYQLSPSGQIGKGKGSWRLFSHQDIYRLGIANFMLKDGFSATFVSLVLRAIEDSDLLDVDENGQTTVPDQGIFRSNTGPRVGFIVRGAKEQPYYVLPLRQLIADIHKRISAHSKGR